MGGSRGTVQRTGGQAALWPPHAYTLVCVYVYIRMYPDTNTPIHTSFLKDKQGTKLRNKKVST